MVYDVIEEVDGYLKHNGEEARVYLEHQSEGYWKNEHMLEQVKKATKIFEAKYPNTIGLFIFNNAPSHTKKPEDELNADAMNVRPGGKQPVMRSTVFNGHVQAMVLS